MKLLVVAGVGLSMLSCAGLPEHTGYWAWHGAEGAGGWLKTSSQKNVVKFQLELSRGAPSMNSGFIEGYFDLEGDNGTFRSAAFGECVIAFQFRGDVVVLDEIASDCGFGYGVSADGAYKLEKPGEPVFSDGDPRFGAEDA